jgi:glycine/D-amino acid oxidase-like deaminating enzyme
MDSIILGGGIIRMLTARQLAQAGQQVVLFGARPGRSGGVMAGRGNAISALPLAYTEPLGAIEPGCVPRSGQGNRSADWRRR